MNDRKIENSLSCKTKRKDTRVRKIKNSKASWDEIDLIVKGRFFVRFTIESYFWSKKSLITHPAERIKIVPRTKMTSILVSGKPSATRINAESVGHKSKKIPIGLSKRAKSIKCFNLSRLKIDFFKII